MRNIGPDHYKLMQSRPIVEIIGVPMDIIVRYTPEGPKAVSLVWSLRDRARQWARPPGRGPAGRPRGQRGRVVSIW